MRWAVLCVCVCKYDTAYGDLSAIYLRLQRGECIAFKDTENDIVSNMCNINWHLYVNTLWRQCDNVAFLWLTHFARLQFNFSSTRHELHDLLWSKQWEWGGGERKAHIICKRERDSGFRVEGKFDVESFAGHRTTDCRMVNNLHIHTHTDNVWSDANSIIIPPGCSILHPLIVRSVGAGCMNFAMILISVLIFSLRLHSTHLCSLLLGSFTIQHSCWRLCVCVCALFCRLRFCLHTFGSLRKCVTHTLSLSPFRSFHSLPQLSLVSCSESLSLFHSLRLYS